MRLERVAHGHTLAQKALLRFIAIVERRPVPDVVRTLLYRKAFFEPLVAEVRVSLAVRQAYLARTTAGA